MSSLFAFPGQGAQQVGMLHCLPEGSSDLLEAASEALGEQVLTLDSAEEKAPGQLLLKHSVTVEIEGEEEPALTAQWLGLIFT